MPITTLSGIVAIFLYLVSLNLHGRAIRDRSARIKAGPIVTMTGIGAALLHLLSAWTLVARDSSYHFGIIEISTLILAVIALLAIITNTRKSLAILVMGVFPVAIVTLLLSMFISSNYPPQQLSGGLAAHVILSILAYSLFALASVQAAFLAFQNYQLRHKHASAVIHRFPPLQDMEKLLFELLWVAQILLSGAILAGFVFVDDLATRGLAHKIVFSILAWVVFAILLWGRHQLGWRGNTAIRGTLGGFLLLLLGFYGSKFVIEYLLGG
ncbi:cytochrome C assembly family protein [Pseudohongiella spirulinae]|uniref:Phosphohydrolase n=1 Tax=Pseudohongiella spirulinae TaxID=1249552 RepID=A0A0S2KC39_9GAMM|nr:cytochrome c biogenesis protein CcsA [Pseudohongiella spirulinae]ALO45900.1 phosphohydrolase [Pseudohongiella spirulinae]